MDTKEGIMSGRSLTRVCLAVVLVLTGACTGSDETGAQEASPEVTPPAVAPSEPSPPAPDESASAAGSEPGQDVQANAPVCEPVDGGAQQCTTTVFEPELSFTLPPGWQPEPAFADTPDSTSYVKDSDADIVPYLGFSRVQQVWEYRGGQPPEPVEAPDDMVTFLSELPGTTASAPESVTVAGRDATQLDITTEEAPSEVPTEECGGPPPPGVFIFYFGPCLGYFLPPGEVVRVVVVEMDGGPPMIITMEAPPSEREETFDDLQQILQSLTIGTAT
jgi:hypothetical protein